MIEGGGEETYSVPALEPGTNRAINKHMATPRKANPQKGGRPSTFRKEVGREICQRIAAGQTLIRICEDDDMPSINTVRAWLFNDISPEFSLAYAQAREAQMDAWSDEIIEIADNAKNDWMERHGKDDTGYQIMGETAARTRLRLDTRKFLMGKIAGKRYGDRMALVGANGGPVATEHTEKQVIDFSTLPAAARAALRAALEAEDE